MGFFDLLLLLVKYYVNILIFLDVFVLDIRIVFGILYYIDFLDSFDFLGSLSRFVFDFV